MTAVDLRFRNSAVRQTVRLQTSDTQIVDGRLVPSGLSSAVEQAIASTFKDASPEVTDRVRKAFQAVMARDWSVAKAWFQDALNRDPGHAGLQRFVALVSPGIKDYGDRGERLAPKQDSALVSLNARASSMTTEQIMKELDAFLMESVCTTCPIK